MITSPGQSRSAVLAKSTGICVLKFAGLAVHEEANYQVSGHHMDGFPGFFDRLMYVGPGAVH